MPINLDEIIKRIQESDGAEFDENGQVIPKPTQEERIAELELKVTQLIVILQHLTGKEIQ